MVLEILKKKVKKVHADISENKKEENNSPETVNQTVKETVLSTVSESKKGN